MQLPQHLQHFPHSTLIVSADTVDANFFLVGGDSLEHLDRLSVPREYQEDARGETKGFEDAHTTGMESDVSDQARMTHFTKQIVEKIDDLVRKHEVATVHLVMPAEVSHKVTESLPGDVKDSLGKTLDLDLMKAAPLEIVERVVGA